MFAILQNNEKFYLKLWCQLFYNSSSRGVQRIDYEAIKLKGRIATFCCGKGGLGQRLGVRLM